MVSNIGIFKVLLLALGGLAAVTAALAPAAQPVSADHTTLALLPAPLLLSPGDQDVLDLWIFGIDGSDRLTSYDLILDYDPAVVVVDAVAGGDGSFAATPTFTIDNDIGRVALSPNQTQDGAAEDALLARITVTAVGQLDASSALTFASVELTGSLDQQIVAGEVLHGRAAVSNTAVMIGTSAVAKGSSTTVPVTIIFTPKGGLAGYNISIGYDPEIIQIDGILPGEPPFGGTPIFSVNEEQSFVNIVGFHGERPGPTGRTAALSIQVTGLALGASPLVLTVKDLVNAIDATSLIPLTANGSVRVISQSAGGTAGLTAGTTTYSVATDSQSALDGAVVSDITPTSGTVIALPGQKVILTIPAGAVERSVFVALREASDSPSPPAPPNHDVGNTVEVNFLDLEGGLLGEVLLLEQASLVMGFTESELETWGPDGIVIQRYEPVLGRWLPLATTVDTVGMSASVLTNRLSVFGLTFGGSGSTGDAQPEQERSTEQPAIVNPIPTSGSGVPGDANQSSTQGISPVTVAVIVVVIAAAIGGGGYLFLRKRNADIGSLA